MRIGAAEIDGVVEVGACGVVSLGGDRTDRVHIYQTVEAIAVASAGAVIVDGETLFKQVLDSGGVLLLDEFDNNLHPALLHWLINLFMDPEHNPHGAQIIFSSHNTNIMDVMTKYRVVVVNKEENESFLYRLDELQGSLLRNDRSIEAIYKSGKIGGTPSL